MSGSHVDLSGAAATPCLASMLATIPRLTKAPQLKTGSWVQELSCGHWPVLADFTGYSLKGIPFGKPWGWMTCPSTVDFASGLPHGYKKLNLRQKVSPNLFSWNQTSWSLHFRGWKVRIPIRTYMIQFVHVYIWHAVPLHAMPCHAISCHTVNTEESIRTRYNTQSMHNIDKMHIQYTHCSHKVQYTDYIHNKPDMHDIQCIPYIHNLRNQHSTQNVP